MRPRFRKVLSDLWINRTRSILIIASITVGLFAIGTIATLREIISEDMRNGYMHSNPANIQLKTSLMSQEIVDQINRVEGVEQAEGAREFAIRLQSAPGEWITLDVRSSTDPGEIQVNQLKLIDGTWPPGENEIAIERYKLNETGAYPGDSVTIETTDGHTKQLKVVGVVNEQTLGAFNIGGGFYLAPAQGYINQDTAEWLGQPRPDFFNTLYLIVEGKGTDEAYINHVANQARQELENAGVIVSSLAIRKTTDHPNRIFADAIAGLLVVLGLLVVFLSGFLITNSLQALVTQQIQQIGIMKTVGARRRQIVGLYMLLILVFSFISIVIAIPLANFIAFRIVSGLVEQINIDFQGYRMVSNAALLQISIGLLIPQFAAAFPILQGAGWTIQESLSGIHKQSDVSQDWLTSLLMRLKRVSRPNLIALRNTVRRKGRLLLTLITLSLGGAVFIATFNVRVSMATHVDRITRYFLGDVNLTLVYPHRMQDIIAALSGLEGISYIEGWGAAQAELVSDSGEAGESVSVLAPPADSRLVQPIIIDGRWIQPGDRQAITLNERFLDSFPDLKIGDTLKLRINEKENEWIVVGFFQLAGKTSGYIAYTNYDYLSGLIGLPEKAITYRIVASQNGLSQEKQIALGRRIETRLRQKGIDVSEITAGKFLSTSAARGFETLTGFLLFLASLTALVGSIGLAGAMSMNVMERTREIGIMRAIGASDLALSKMVLLEGILIGFISWVMAVLLAFPISEIMSDAVSNALFGSSSSLELTPAGFLFWLLIVMVLSVLASLMPARSATRLTIREVLAYE